MACLRALQHVHRSRGLPVRTYLKWPYDIGLRIKQYHGRQWRTSTRQKLMHCDIWAMVRDVLQQRTGQTRWSHQYGRNQCPFNDKADAFGKQAATTHPLQSRPCVLRRPGEPLAPSGSRNVRPKRNAQGAANFGSVARRDTAQTERPLGPRGVTHCQTKRQWDQFASAVTHFDVPKRPVNASRRWS